MGIRSQNNPIATYLDVFSRSGTEAGNGGGAVQIQGMTASGGIVSDYSDSGDVYRAHVFTSTGTFDVTALSPDPSSYPDEIDILLIGGGGGGGSQHGGGGGAGGWVTKTSYPIPSSVPAPYTVTIGAGGRGGLGGGTSSPDNYGGSGTDTEFYAVGASYPGSNRFRAIGGGGGSQYYNGNNPQGGGAAGGSGGGGATNGGGNESAPSTPHGGATQPGANPGTPNIIQYGYDGGVGGNSDAGGGGGGGAGGVGQSRPSNPTQANGGAGRANTYAYGPTNPITYAAGGGGGGNNQKGGNGGHPLAGHGGGQPAPRVSPLHPTVPASLGGPVTAFEGTMAEPGTGHGGGASAANTSRSGYGGSGTVVVRYKISSVATRKATGGAISEYGGKTIHTFTGSGTFTTTGAFNETVEYLIIGGGGGGGRLDGGGGGAGAFRTADNLSVSVNSSTSMAVNIGAGGIGAPNINPTVKGTNGGPSSVAFPSGTITSDGGGGGGSHSGNETGSPSQSPGNGSGGGAAHHPTNQAGGTGGTYGSNGGTGYGGGSGTNAGGGGGGAGGGGVGAASGLGNSVRSQGGAGLQSPATFQDPKSNVGFPGSSGGFWFAGGGGGGSEPNFSGGAYQGSGGAAPLGNSYAGAGIGGRVNDERMSVPTAAQDAKANSGSGGGGGGYTSSNGGPGAHGGSGIVLIAYPT